MTSPLAGQQLEGEYSEHDKPPSVAQDQPEMKQKATDNKEAEMRAKYQKGDKMDLPVSIPIWEFRVTHRMLRFAPHRLVSDL